MNKEKLNSIDDVMIEMNKVYTHAIKGTCDSQSAIQTIKEIRIIGIDLGDNKSSFVVDTYANMLINLLNKG